MEDQSKIMRDVEDRQKTSSMHMTGRKTKQPSNHLATWDHGSQESSLLEAEVFILPKIMGSHSDAPKSWLLHSFSV